LGWFRACGLVHRFVASTTRAPQLSVLRRRVLVLPRHCALVPASSLFRCSAGLSPGLWGSRQFFCREARHLFLLPARLSRILDRLRAEETVPGSPSKRRWESLQTRAKPGATIFV